MTGPHLCEYEDWPGPGPKPAGRRPTPLILALLATTYSTPTSTTCLISLTTLAHNVIPKANAGTTCHNTGERVGSFPLRLTTQPTRPSSGYL